jgi:hypothetical protein
MTDITPSWKDFDHAGVSKTDTRPMFSLQVSGALQFNKAAFEMLGRPEALRLMYDDQHNLIGFRPAKVGERSAYVVRKADNAERYGISAKAFTNYFGIPLSETRRYEARKYGDVVAVNLNEPDSVSARGSRSSGA